MSRRCERGVAPSPAGSVALLAGGGQGAVVVAEIAGGRLRRVAQVPGDRALEGLVRIGLGPAEQVARLAGVHQQVLRNGAEQAKVLWEQRVGDPDEARLAAGRLQ